MRTMDENALPAARRERVTISQRLAPAVAFGLTNLGGMLCAWWVIRLFDRLRTDDTVTARDLMNYMASISEDAGLIYAVALVVSVVSIVVLFMRSDEEEATLPGVVFVMAIPTLIAPVISTYALELVIGAFHSPMKTDFTKLGEYI